MEPREKIREEVINIALLSEAYLKLARIIYTLVSSYQPAREETWKLVEYINHPNVRWLTVTANSYVSLAILDLCNLLDARRKNTLNLGNLLLIGTAESKIEKLWNEFKAGGFLELRHTWLAHKSLRSKDRSYSLFFSTYKNGWLDKLLEINAGIKLFIGEEFPPIIGNNFFSDQLESNRATIEDLLGRTREQIEEKFKKLPS